MQLYNSLTRQIEPFLPRQANDAAEPITGPITGSSAEPIKVYVCGITPYDTTHLGHAFTYVMADVLLRYLEFRGHAVIYVQNVTDIDDDILRRAASEGDDWLTLGNRWTQHFIRDMQSLNVRPPDVYPRATDVIPEIIQSVQALIDRGLAYEANGSVYYRADAWPDFGKLSRLSGAQMLETANERGNNPDDPNKRHPLDFVLWQAQAPGEPAWQSPWGDGRPGWHIECSSMVSKYLGDTIDLHSGGSDLLFPHHECEIAQIEPLIGKKPFVRCWLHTAMVELDGEKMSKSLGNLIMIREVLADYSADAIRYYLANHHYRQAWEHEPAALEAAAEAVNSLAAAMSQGGSPGQSSTGQALDARPNVDAFMAALDDDLDTVTALEVMNRLGREVQEAARAGAPVESAQTALRQMATVFGLRLTAVSPEARVIEGWDKHLARFA